MVEISLKPAVLITLDPSQYGFIAGSSTTFALISMFHQWLSTTGGTEATVRTSSSRFQIDFRPSRSPCSDGQASQLGDQAKCCQLDY